MYDSIRFPTISPDMVICACKWAKVFHLDHFLAKSILKVRYWIRAIEFDLRINRTHDQISAIHKPSVAGDKCLSWRLAIEKNNLVGRESTLVPRATSAKKPLKVTGNYFC